MEFTLLSSYDGVVERKAHIKNDSAHRQSRFYEPKIFSVEL